MKQLSDHWEHICNQAGGEISPITPPSISSKFRIYSKTLPLHWQNKTNSETQHLSRHHREILKHCIPFGICALWVFKSSFVPWVEIHALVSELRHWGSQIFHVFCMNTLSTNSNIKIKTKPRNQNGTGNDCKRSINVITRRISKSNKYMSEISQDFWV